MAVTRRNADNEGHYKIKHELFWTVLLALLSGTFYLGQLIGNTRFDISTNEIREKNKVLTDSLKLQRKAMERMRFVSDSALNILGHMPYEQMKLDTSEFRKVQTNIESAGAALYLNINYKP
ncbi:MAG TPA: hypothetical protein VKB19_10390 [Pedobacter sp.]|nr:hypothetical protein [Pedobacter sp.]